MMRTPGLFSANVPADFDLIVRPWKMYPLGVLFGLGFDTSSQVALLGLSSIESAAGTSLWLILLFPLLFTAGMCLLDTTDGALMLALYTSTGKMSLDSTSDPASEESQANTSDSPQDPLAILYFNLILTGVTVVVAIVIGTIQVLGLIDRVAAPTGRFWDGLRAVQDSYDIVGGVICGAFVVAAVLSIAFYKRWRAWAERQQQRNGQEQTA